MKTFNCLFLEIRKIDNRIKFMNIKNSECYSFY